MANVLNKWLSELSQKLGKLKHIRYFSSWIIFLMDFITLTGATCFTYLIISYLRDYPSIRENLISLLVISMVASFVPIYFFKTYRHVIRYSRIRDLWEIAYGVVLKIAILFLIVKLSGKTLFFSEKHFLTFILFDGMLSFISLVSIRLVLILGYDALSLVKEKITRQKRLLCYGVDAKSVALKTRLEQSPHFKIVGFYMYGKDYEAYQIAGIPIYYFTDKNDFVRLIRKKDINGILFAGRKDVRAEKDRLIRYCEQYNIKTLIAPSINEVNEDSLAVQTLRNIRIEDLLGREEIQINKEELIRGFSNKTVLVTGAAGSIGRELCLQLADLGIKKLLPFDSAETPLHNLRLELQNRFPELDFVPLIGDVRSHTRTNAIFSQYRPEIILHAAAYKHVPLMEENPCEAVYVNVLGTKNIADMAVRYNAQKMIMISSDKVVNPTNVMGASKRLAEIYVQSLGMAIQEGIVEGETQFVTTRFGNVLGSNGSVIPLFKEQIEKGGPLTVTHPDIIRFFMTIPEACRLVLEAALMGSDSEIFVFKMGEPVKITDLATRMIELAGFVPEKDIHITYTGLRPGEKLYEEVLSTEENSIPTHHEKINIAKVRKYAYKQVVEELDALEKLVRAGLNEETVRQMKKIIPEFISKNSVYQKFDGNQEQHPDFTS